MCIRDRYFITLHVRLSSLFYATQLVDIFSYETTRNLSTLGSFDAKTSYSYLSKSSISVIVYNYHNLLTQNRLFVFSSSFAAASRSKFLGLSASLFSIAELFYSFLIFLRHIIFCLLYTSPSPRDRTRSRMPSSA